MEKLTILHTIPSPSDHLCGLAWEKGHLWYSDGKEDKIYKLETKTGNPIAVFQIPRVNTSLSWNDGFLWQVTGKGYLTDPKNVTKIDPTDGKVVETIPLGLDSKYIAGIDVRGGTVWVSLEEKGRLQLRQLYTNNILRDYEVEPRIAGIVLANSSFFYCEFNKQLLVEIDPEAGKECARYRVDGNPTGLTWDGEYIWYNDYTGKKICKLKPS
jgi:glutamine cyclotransferase